MLDYASEADGEKIPEKGDSEFKEALGECIAAIEPTMVVDENNNPIGSTGLNKEAKKDKIEEESESHEEDTPLSDLIEDDEIAGLETIAYENGVKASMKVAEVDAIKKAAKRSASKRIPLEKIRDYEEGSLERMLAERIKIKGKKYASLEKYLIKTIKDYDVKSPERILLKKILEYDKDEMFSYSNSVADSMGASYGHDFLKALKYLFERDYNAMKKKIKNIRYRHKRRKEPISEQVQYFIEGLEGLAKKRKEEETTKQQKKKYKKRVQEEYEESKRMYEEVHKRKPRKNSKQWIDKKHGHIISPGITKKDEERVRKEAEAAEELRRKTTNYNKK